MVRVALYQPLRYVSGLAVAPAVDCRNLAVEPEILVRVARHFRAQDASKPSLKIFDHALFPLFNEPGA